MHSLTRVASAMLMAAALVSGCSSSSNNKDGSSSGGPQPATKLVDLTPMERSQLCMQLSSNGSGAVSCPDAGAVPVAIGICTSIQPDCSATVSTLETCTTKLMADACDFKAYTADLATPECLVMQACTAVLCTGSLCFCSNNNALTQCQTSCKTFTKGLTVDCASCVAGVFSATLMCPDFTMLPSPYDQCAATCAAHGG
ncbi:MAG TPA: hypothetical protein VGP64_15140 [Polyangia bacterium]|jgi:hypothetical protein